MAIKRRIIYEDEDDDDDDSGNNRGSSSNKRSRGASGETEIRPAEVPAAEPSGTRRSARSGKGNGGRLAQMKMLERIQTEQLKWPSRIDVALQGEQINPMAPSSQDAREQGSHCRQVDSNSPDTISLQSHAPLRSPQPVFSLAAASQEFSFRLPDVASQAHMSAGTAAQTQVPPRARFRGVVSESSSKSVSSRSPSIFSTGPSRCRGTSTAPTSRTPSLCSTGEQMHLHSAQRRDDAGSASALPHSSFSQAASETSIPQMFRFEDFNEQSADPPLADRTTRLQCTASFYDVPLTVDENSHSITAAPRVREDRGELQIDEASPSEDDRFAEEMLRRPSPRQGDKGLSGASCELPVGRIDDVMTLDRTATPPRQERYQAPTRSRQGNPATAAQEAEDIVAAHRKRNRAPRLPSSTQLLATKQRQTSSTTSVGLGDQGTPPITQVPAKSQEISSATETAIHGHGISDTDATKPVGPATEGAEPWQLQYYDPSARDIIDRAKQFSHCDAASINAFPVRSPVYVEILGLMSKCDTSPIHQAKTRTLCIRWAKLGSNGMAKQEPGVVSSGFDVDLT
ncbi:hypothetical protein EDD15DRAFT_2381695 [Pisolithus albus]|nr:hypothetical protein EDD15DRAFT_2381695 [Pisolithus albus]